MDLEPAFFECVGRVVVAAAKLDFMLAAMVCMVRPVPEDLYAIASFRRPGGLVCLVNVSGADVPLPESEVLLAGVDVSGGAVPSDTAVWLRA
ncbi:hypothetical protein [Geodermatophilus ruber]|uniref:hypothetical protein n=1 Tax=Geodermatophilus ruber TaxID=504800 RepID=UPI000B86E44A|nr:hypothetical protein [Geodermatophilus ruber]